MKVFKNVRNFNSSPKEIFAAIKNPDILKNWWGPNGFSNTFHSFNFFEGGKWSFIMHGPDGVDYPNEMKFLKIVEPTIVSIRHDCAPFFTLTIELVANQNGTQLTWIQDFDDEKVAESIRHIIEPANEQNLDRLLSVLK